MLSQLLTIKTDNTYIQLFRYTFVGCIAFICDFSVLYLLTEFFMFHYLVSAALAFLLGLTVNYILSVNWVFNSRSLENRYAEFVVYSLIGVAGLALNELIIWGFTEYFMVHYLGSKIISTVIVYVFNFTVRKSLLFR